MKKVISSHIGLTKQIDTKNTNQKSKFRTIIDQINRVTTKFLNEDEDIETFGELINQFTKLLSSKEITDQKKEDITVQIIEKLDISKSIKLIRQTLNTPPLPNKKIDTNSAAQRIAKGILRMRENYTPEDIPSCEEQVRAFTDPPPECYMIDEPPRNKE